MLAIYGGSFNPVTKAHKIIVNRIRELDFVSKVIVVPVSDNYSKESLNTEARHRLKMLEMVMDEDIVVSDYEIIQQRQLKSLETLTYFSKLYQKDAALVIGSDNLRYFSRWYKPEEILKKFYLIVINRQDNLEKIIAEDKLLSEYEERIFEINDLNIRISSTEAKDKLNEEFLEPDIIAYIKENNLYQE